MTREEAIKELKITMEYLKNIGVIGNLANDGCEEALQMSIKALEQEPTTKNDLSSELEKNSKKLEKNFGELDCISRVKVIDYLCKHCPDDGECFEDCDEIKHLRQMPSVTPIRPKGHWINKSHLFESCSAECSSCHKRSNGYMHDNGFSLECKYYDYCPKCGSDNREVEG